MKYGLSSNLIRLICVGVSAGVGVWCAVLAPSLAVTFIPPQDNSAPGHSDGGASRSSVRFIPPRDSSAPDHAAGGASRIGFIPPSDNAAPDHAAGGASRIGFIPPPENATPQDAVSGASREGEALALFFAEEESGVLNEFVPNHATTMMAVTPSNLYGLTVSARPTVMAYLPETKAHTAIFSLKDESQAVIYRQVVSLKGADGILRITLGDDAPELAVGKYYQWFVTLQTDEYLTPASPYVTAWIKRVDVASVLGQAVLPAGLEKAKMLAQAGIWYDAAEQLAELQINAQAPLDTTADWTEFLSSVGLDALLGHAFL